MSLFAQSPQLPLAERMRPRSLEELVGQDHLLAEDAFLGRAIQSGRIFSVIFWGPPGSGKTTLARLTGVYARVPFHAFSAVASGIKALRQIITSAEAEMENRGKPVILFVDEIHRFNKAQQDAFLPHVESGLIILIGATTQNPSFEVIPPLLSRTRTVILKPLKNEAIQSLIHQAVQDKERGLGTLDVRIDSEAMTHLTALSNGDARVALNNLESAVNFALEDTSNGPVRLDLKTVERALNRQALPHDKDGDAHYDTISAFHKSLRGSDVQASVYWLYRMLMAGEDPLFICRRMIRFASEDVGLADPAGLRVALSAFEAWEKVGPPEAELALAEAAIYLAAAPKSNALYLAEKAVKSEIERSGPLPVPLHIRNAPTPLMKRKGYGRGYRYPHNYAGAWVDQEYLPEKVKGLAFYRPTQRGEEESIKRRLIRLAQAKRRATKPQS